MTKDEILAEGPHAMTLEEIIRYLRSPTGITGDLGNEVCIKAANLLESYTKAESESGPGSTPYTPKQPPKEDDTE